MKFKTLFALALISLLSLAWTALASEGLPQNFLFLGGDSVASVSALLGRPDIAGAQVVYNWRELEPERNRYDFSRIAADLASADAAHKKLFIQIQDRFFDPKAKNLPDYLMTDPTFAGGIAAQSDNAGAGKTGSGWVAAQWNPAVRGRYQKLLAALAKDFDGRVYGVDLPETAIDLDEKHPPAGFTCDAYFDAEMQNLAFARTVFRTSRVVQYVNFWPCEWNNDHNYMGRLFDYAQKHDIGLGGPDLVPGRKGQMKNSYPFFNRDKGKLPLVAMAVQEPTLSYLDPKTNKPFTRDALVAFAQSYLGANIIFWTPSAPWLKP